MKELFFIFSLFVVLRGFCQSDNLVGPQNLALGSSSGEKNLWTAWRNPALTTSSANQLLLGTFVQKLYALSDWHQTGLAFQIQSKNWQWGSYLFYNGSPHWNQKHGYIFLSRKLAKDFQCGLGLQMNQEFASNRNKQHYSYSGTVGFNIQLDKYWRLAFSIKNIQEQSSKMQGNIGLCFEPNKQITWILGAFQTQTHPISFHSGLRYKLPKIFTFRCGIRSIPSAYSYGVEIDLSYLSIQFGFENHQSIGLNPIVGIQKSL